MFFREKRSPNSKGFVLQLVENVRTEKGPRQRVIVSLGTKLDIPKADRRVVGSASFDCAGQRVVDPALVEDCGCCGSD